MITLYSGDCLAIMPTLPDNSMEAIITDPPYNECNRDDHGLRSFDKGIADSSPIDIPALADEFVRLARGSVYVWCGFRQVSAWCDALVLRGLSIRVGVWDKINPSPVAGDYLWLSALELCVYGRKPLAYFSEHCAKPIWSGPSELVDGFPTPKPVWLMRRLIQASVSPGGLVLDPFMGSGSTGVACILEGRNFVGIELNKEYAEIARRRIDDMVGPLFTGVMCD